MSEPVTNVEIEDVLSSIRRLVSNEGRSDSDSPPKSAKPADKLVLTPALRVDEESSTAPETDEPADDRAEDPPEPEHGQPDAAVDAAALSEPFTDQQPDDMPLELPVDQHDEATDDSSEAEMPDRSDELAARIAELEQVVAASPDEWEPDGESSDAYSGGPVEPLPWEDYDGDADEVDIADGETDQIEDEPAQQRDAATEEAPDAAEAATDDTPQHDDDQNDDHQPGAEGAAAPEAAARGADDGDDPRGALEGEDMLAGSDEILDEDALRDLVAEIVRQELQGALGERITRNVRKLVRREIHRALACQELE